MIQAIPVIFERLAELLESKMSMSKSLRQVAEEMRDLEYYCSENSRPLNFKHLTTDHLRTRKYK